MTRSNTTIVDEVGDTVIIAYTFEAIPVGATFQMMWRARADDDDPALIDITGVVDGDTITFTATAAQTRALGPGHYAYDAQRDVDGVIETFDRGTIQLRQDVTR